MPLTGSLNSSALPTLNQHVRKIGQSYTEQSRFGRWSKAFIFESVWASGTEEHQGVFRGPSAVGQVFVECLPFVEACARHRGE